MKNFSLKNIFMIILLFLLILQVVSSCAIFRENSADDLNLIRVRITRVIDGDTAYARFPGGRERKVRFIGVDAPEINHPVKGIEPFGPVAEAYTRSKLEGELLWLEIDTRERDQYGRILAYLWLSIPEEISESEIREKMFNARLLIEGYAFQVIFPPNVKYVDYFTLFSAEARDNNRGLWGLTEEAEYNK
jgi:micrococcal nuclease